MVYVNSPSYCDRDRLRRWNEDIVMWKWRRHEFKFPEIFFLETPRSNIAFEVVASTAKHASVPSEETADNVRPSEDL